MMPMVEGLPEELIKLFKPLCCDLCETKLNSPSTARLHYESKNHEKKINKWLSTWAEETGEPIPKRPSVCKIANNVKYRLLHFQLVKVNSSIPCLSFELFGCLSIFKVQKTNPKMFHLYRPMGMLFMGF